MAGVDEAMEGNEKKNYCFWREVMGLTICTRCKSFY